MEIKRTAAFFANSRLRVVGMGSGGWKRAALGGNKERFVRKKGFGFAIKAFFRLMQSNPIKKKLFSAQNDTDFALHQS